MKVDPYSYILTIDVVADAVQFTDANSATAIVGWINDLVRNGPGPGASYDRVRNIVAWPASARPSRLESGWWVVRWPSGELAAHAPESFAAMLGPPGFGVHPPTSGVGQHGPCHDRSALRFT